MIKLDTTGISDIKIGSAQIGSVYAGSNLVWTKKASLRIYCEFEYEKKDVYYMNSKAVSFTAEQQAKDNSHTLFIVGYSWGTSPNYYHYEALKTLSFNEGDQVKVVINPPGTSDDKSADIFINDEVVSTVNLLKDFSGETYYESYYIEDRFTKQYTIDEKNYVQDVMDSFEISPPDTELFNGKTCFLQSSKPITIKIQARRQLLQEWDTLTSSLAVNSAGVSYTISDPLLKFYDKLRFTRIV